jgi:hypothetical protein
VHPNNSNGNCIKRVVLEAFKSPVFTGLKKAPHLLMKSTASFLVKKSLVKLYAINQRFYVTFLTLKAVGLPFLSNFIK